MPWKSIGVKQTLRNANSQLYKGSSTYFTCDCACHAHSLILNHHPDLNSMFISLGVCQVCWLPDSQMEVTTGWHEVTADWNEHLYFHLMCPNESAFGSFCCNWEKCIWYKRKDRYTEIRIFTQKKTDCFLVAREGILSILFSQPLWNEQYIHVAQTASSDSEQSAMLPVDSLS